jgi:serine/threonine protein kinase
LQLRNVIPIADLTSRHHDSVVVLDRDSQQLVLRNADSTNGDLEVELTDCPYCHRPIRDREAAQSAHRGSDPAQPEFVNPNYFRLLHDSLPSSAEGTSPPPSPRRRLVRPALADGPTTGSDYAGTTPSPQGISSAAFSQGYFKKFFVEEAELGRGGKGVVLLVRHVLDGVSLGHFACKRVPVGDDHEWLEKVLAEVQLLQHLSHQNLVSYRHVWLENSKLTTFGPSVPCAFILQQYCNAGDLHKYVFVPLQTSSTAQQLKERIRRRSKGQPDPPVGLPGPRKLQFDEIYSFFKDIAAGLRFLHINGYIHRDLKPSNCLLHETGHELRVLVSDFGEVQSENSVRKSTGTTGTVSYCAPEVLRPAYPNGPLGNFTFKSDVFSLGMILHFLCFAQLPYRNADVVEEKEDLDQLRAEISEWKGFDDSLKKIRPELPDKLYTILERLLSVDVDRRPTSDEVLSSIQAGVTGNESRRFGRASSAGPEFRAPSRIHPVESPAPVSPRSSRSPTAKSFPLNAPPVPAGPNAMYVTRRTKSPSLGSESETDNLLSHSPEHNLILHPRFRGTPSSSPPQAGEDHEQNYARPIVHHHRHPQLLPPPPDSSLGSNSFLVYVRLGSWGLIPLPSVRFSLFILKLTVALQSCVPLAVNPWVHYPLVVLAVLTLGSRSMKVQLMSLVVHIMLVVLSIKTRVMCILDVPSPMAVLL